MYTDVKLYYWHSDYDTDISLRCGGSVILSSTVCVAAL